MENSMSFAMPRKSELRFWLASLGATSLIAIALLVIESVNHIPGMRRTFFMTIMPYTILGAGLFGPLLYLMAKGLREKRHWANPGIGALLILAVLLCSAVMGLSYLAWFTPAPLDWSLAWRFLSKEVIGISFPFWLVLLSIWLWDTRRQIARLKVGQEVKLHSNTINSPKSISATYGKAKHMLKEECIQFIKAEGNYCKLYSEGRFYLKNSSLKKLESLCPNMLRIHRSTIVNPTFISSISSAGHGDLKVSLISGEELKCSRSFSKSLKEALSL